jgi:hypothetical protein
VRAPRGRAQGRKAAAEQHARREHPHYAAAGRFFEAGGGWLAPPLFGSGTHGNKLQIELEKKKRDEEFGIKRRSLQNG